MNRLLKIALLLGLLIVIRESYWVLKGHKFQEFMAPFILVDEGTEPAWLYKKNTNRFGIMYWSGPAVKQKLQRIGNSNQWSDAEMAKLQAVLTNNPNDVLITKVADDVAVHTLLTNAGLELITE